MAKDLEPDTAYWGCNECHQEFVSHREKDIPADHLCDECRPKVAARVAAEDKAAE